MAQVLTPYVLIFIAGFALHSTLNLHFTQKLEVEKHINEEKEVLKYRQDPPPSNHGNKENLLKQDDLVQHVSEDVAVAHDADVDRNQPVVWFPRDKLVCLYMIPFGLTTNTYIFSLI